MEWIITMLRNTLCGAAFIAAAILVLTLSGPVAFAAVSDYRFDLVSARPAGSGQTDVTIRLVHLPDARPVSGAVIFQPQAVMAGMESMPSAATVEPGQQPGSYMAGTNQLASWYA